MILAEINFTAVAFLTVLYYALGALWYSPLLFADPWMRSLGITQSDIEDLQLPIWINYLVTFAFSLLTILAFALIFAAVQVDSLAAACGWSLLLFVGFNLHRAVKSLLWETAPLKLVAIDYGYDLVAYLIIGVILVVW